MKRSLVPALLIAASLTVVQAQPAQYRTRLSMVPTDLPMQATIAGFGAATATLKGTTLTINGTISGSIELTKPQIDDLAAGRLYIQLHSQKAPDGNLWGWLLASEKK